jgi:transcriptional regulator with XRE-family HTH domain
MSGHIVTLEKNSYEGYGPLVSFGTNVRRLRKAANVKANELARMVETSPSAVSAWENDKGGLPETPTLFRLAKALNCSIGELLVGVDADYDSLIARAEAEEVALQAAMQRIFDITERGGSPTSADMQELARVGLLKVETSRALMTLRDNIEALGLLSPEERALIEARRRGDLTRQSGVEESALPTGGAADNDPASAREELDRLRGHLSEAQNVARHLLALLTYDALSDESSDASGEGAEGSSGHRAAR